MTAMRETAGMAAEGAFPKAAMPSSKEYKESKYENIGLNFDRVSTMVKKL
jgi:hypothetical protein